MMGGHGRGASGSDARDARAFRLDSSTGCVVIECRHQIKLRLPDLQCDRTLARFRNHGVHVETGADLVSEPETIEPTCSEHDRIEATFASLSKGACQRCHEAAR